ncbi:response regulator [Pedobacter petrophilus]|uniref:Response regulator n=2 Tax=Pedobacter TaxID=84567 RepID=A0A7K0G6F7_9SPHI|nr:LytTR family DNA-binding domain-containing protein [Pedobacter petrophilus]MRX78576.1 response regulator [Pedobacter petrophilus]
MIRTIIIDDEEMNVNNLQALLHQHCPEIEIIATAQSAQEARHLVKTFNPEVVFLDIEMPFENGFDFLRSLDNLEFEVVFVTAYDVYGIKAIKFSALDYLLKPINVKELKSAVQKIISSVGKKKQHTRLANLFSLLEDKHIDVRAKIALPSLKETYLVPIHEIVRCFSSNNYTTFFLTDGTEHLISKPLYEYDEMLTPYGFIRCHQSHLINKAHVTRILNLDSGYLVLNYSEQHIPIAKQRKAAVVAALK